MINRLQHKREYRGSSNQLPSLCCSTFHVPVTVKGNHFNEESGGYSSRRGPELSKIRP